VLGAVLGSVVGGGFGDLIVQGAQYSSQVSTLKFSRDQEYQSDTLGIRYITSAGYDPLASATMLAALTRASALEARVQGRDSRSTPEWASTHPLSENRVRQAAVTAQATRRAGQGLRNRDVFLNQLEGIYVDDDPAQGVIEGRSFTHPDLRLQFTVPAGFLMQNGTRAVTIEGSSGKAQFSTAPFNGDVNRYIQTVLYQLTQGKAQLQMSPIQQTNVNGIPAFYTVGRANTGDGAVDVGVFVYQWDSNTAYHFVTLSRGGAGFGAFQPMFGSLRRISTAEASAIRPRVIDVVTAARGDTVQSLSRRMAYRDFQLERFLSLNGLAANSALVPGQMVKLVVYGERRS
jgi:predicted Zn-dependent protease